MKVNKNLTSTNSLIHMMKIDISPLEKALSQLEVSVQYLQSELAKDPGLYNQFRNSAIQCFEYTYELTYKMIRRQLEQNLAIPGEIRQMNFPDFIRTAAEAGLLSDVKRFLRYRELRNITSHTYDEKKADEIIKHLPEFIKDVHFLIKELKNR